MNVSASLLAGLIGLSVAGCSSPMKVVTEYDPGANFSELRSYAWHVSEGERGVVRATANPQSERRIQQAVERELNDRGYRKVSSEPDFLVGFYVVEEGVTDAQTVITDQKLGYVSAETQYQEYQKGTLVLMIADAEEKKVIWQGAASETFTSPTREEIDKAIDRAVRDILSEFPPKR